LSKSNPSEDVKDHFNFPNDEATFDTLYLAIQQQIEVCSDEVFVFSGKIFEFLENNKIE
jgi:hypothetical protein